jgi:glycosyltransferase involved in cell wall biosynthesis
MRIVIVTSWPTEVINGSGTAVYFHALVGGLEQRGYTVEIIAPDFDASDYVQVTLQRFLFNTDLPRDPRLNGADLIIGLDYDGYGLDPSNRPPLLTSVHAVYGDVIQWESEPFRTMVEAQAFFDRVAMQRSDFVVIGSEYAKQRVVDLYGISPDKIAAVPHGMVQPAWLPLVETEPPQPNDHPILLSVGKMFPRKRIDVLLQAMVLLIEDFPTIELRIVGSGLEWDHLHVIANELGITSNVTWLSHISNDAAFAHEWRQADIFCHSSAQETFGYVFLEAMSLGKPIVAANAGAAPEVLADSALLVHADDPHAFADAIRRFLHNPTLRAEYGQRARQRTAHFSLDHMIDGYEAIINRLVSG